MKLTNYRNHRDQLPDLYLLSDLIFDSLLGDITVIAHVICFDGLLWLTYLLVYIFIVVVLLCRVGSGQAINPLTNNDILVYNNC